MFPIHPHCKDGLRRFTAVCTATLLASVASAQFTGGYAPGTWTVSIPSEGGSATFSPPGDLTITGPDSAFGCFPSQNVDVTHAVVTADGTWSFDWSYSSANTSSGFDNAYYLLNGTPVFLGTTDVFSGPVSGSVSVPVSTGDTIGWRVESDDCIFGAGTLDLSSVVFPPPAALSLIADDTCYQTGDKVTIAVRMEHQVPLIVGGQFFMEYDDSVLSFLSAEPGDATATDPLNPFEVEVFESHVAPSLIYAVGVTGGGPGTSDDTDMAYLYFEAIDDICDAAGLVFFVPSIPPTQLTVSGGAAVAQVTNDLGAITLDGTAPDFDLPCPLPDITVNADAGTCEASGTTVDPDVQTATDNCDLSPDVSFIRSDGKPLLSDPYEAADSPITITWSAEDDCGNIAVCTQTVTVNGVNDVIVAVELAGSMDPGPFTRCVTFQLFDEPSGVPTTVDRTISFTGGLGSDSFTVPCGVYDCITARDPLHTLRSKDSDDFAIVGVNYNADFTGGDALIGGNLQGDFWIDILDFGVYVSQFSAALPASTTCADAPPHSDINGDGVVDTLDFSFIQVNFLEGHEPNCSDLAGVMAPAPGSGPSWQQAPQLVKELMSDDGPVTRISVRALVAEGMGELAVADLNHDGWLDGKDMQMFFAGK